MKTSELTKSQGAGRIAHCIGWLGKHKLAIGYFVFLNVGIFLVGFFLSQYGDAMLQHPLYRLLDVILPYIVPLRIGAEIVMYFKWRNVVGWARRTFKLSHKATWFLLRCRPLFKLMMLLDIALHTIILAGRISL